MNYLSLSISGNIIIVCCDSDSIVYDSVAITGVSWLLIAGLLGIVCCAACGAMTRVEVEERMPEPRRSTRRGRGRNPRLCSCC